MKNIQRRLCLYFESFISNIAGCINRNLNVLFTLSNFECKDRIVTDVLTLSTLLYMHIESMVSLFRCAPNNICKLQAVKSTGTIFAWFLLSEMCRATRVFSHCICIKTHTSPQGANSWDCCFLGCDPQSTNYTFDHGICEICFANFVNGPIVNSLKCDLLLLYTF
jgi:hypothetical protein